LPKPKLHYLYSRHPLL